MKNLIILAAGSGKRLLPHTDKVPKCLVKLKNKTLLERNISEWRAAGDFNITIVSGYKSKKLLETNFPCIHNAEFESTNMVWSLAKTLKKISKIKDDFIYISYGDIIVSKANVHRIMESDNEVNVLIDQEWEKLWSLRMADYLSDVESLICKDGRIIEIGKKTKNIKHIQGQYIGVLKINRKILIDELIAYLDWVKKSINKNQESSRKNLYLTEFLQRFIDNGIKVSPIFIKGGWLEVDSCADLEAYEKNWNKQSIYKEVVS